MNIGILIQEKGLFVYSILILFVLMYRFRYIGLHPYQKRERWISVISTIALFAVTLPLIIWTSPIGGNRVVYLLFSVNISISVFLGIKHFGITIL